MNFITGHSFKNIAHFILDEYGFRSNKKADAHTTPIFFVKTDYIDQFFKSNILPIKTFNLITHNSDYSINSKHHQYLEYSHLSKWYAQNVDYQHNKLISIPIGIANPEWPHGNISILKNIIDAKYEKKFLMYANFNISTNRKQRQSCLQNIDKKYVEQNVPFHQYLKKIAQSYFNICPLGNGIDSHRIWESLYLKTVPIVENTYNIKYLKESHNLPIVLVNDWSQLSKLSLNSTIYQNLMKNFNIDVLKIENFLNEYTNI